MTIRNQTRLWSALYVMGIAVFSWLVNGPFLDLLVASIAMTWFSEEIEKDLAERKERKR